MSKRARWWSSGRAERGRINRAGAAPLLALLGLLCLPAMAAAQCRFPYATDRQNQLPPDLTPVSLVVTFPTDGAIVGTQAIQVYGTFTGPPNTGVSVDDASALQGQGAFLSHDVQLVPGANTVVVKVTAASGETQTISRSVTYDPLLAPNLEIGSAFIGDYSPFSLKYSFFPASNLSRRTLSRIRADYDTDGTFEVDTTDTAVRLSARYVTPGIKLATIELTYHNIDSSTPPLIMTATRRAIAENLGATSQTLCHAFARYRGYLTAQKYDAALSTFTEDAQPRYTAYMLGLGDNGPTLASGLGSIVDGTIGQHLAELMLGRPIPGSPGNFRSFPLQFERGADGVWRIASL